MRSRYPNETSTPRLKTSFCPGKTAPTRHSRPSGYQRQTGENFRSSNRPFARLYLVAIPPSAFIRYIRARITTQARFNSNFGSKLRRSVVVFSSLPRPVLASSHSPPSLLIPRRFIPSRGDRYIDTLLTLPPAYVIIMIIIIMIMTMIYQRV